MSESLPSITVIIAARPGQGEIKAVAAARELKYDSGKLEILVARGRQPSIQRNTALRASRGEIIYFLDDDSVPNADNLQRAISAFADRSVVMLGGPNLCPKEAPFIEQIFALVHASWLAFGPSRARYCPVGLRRSSGEKELILCNLMARREQVLQAGGFNEALYPNEENALMDELIKQGGQLIYDPDFQVRRRPRPTVKAFVRMLLNYGRGRAEQFRLHPTFGSVANFVPPLYCVYLIGQLILLALVPAAWIRFVLSPLYFYAAAVLLQVAALIPLGGILRAVCASPFIFLTHLLYGIGFWRGLFTDLKKTRKSEITAEVVLEQLQPLILK